MFGLLVAGASVRAGIWSSSVESVLQYTSPRHRERPQPGAWELREWKVRRRNVLAKSAAPLVALLAGAAAAIGAVAPAEAEAAAPAQQASAEWPVPIPDWFWVWARWYLGHGEFKDRPFRSAGTRPEEAPRTIPDWAWRRLAALVGDESGAPPPGEEPAPSPEAQTWAIPIPGWFWPWARWYLGRGEFADGPPQNPATRPSVAPRLVPEWGWRRLIVLQGGTPPPLPTEPLSRGARGREVEGLQRALNAAGYAAGPIDGRFGARTRDGVIAFEKVHGLARDGVVSPQEYPMIIRELRPQPPVGGRRNYVYVDLRRQVLFDVRKGRVSQIVAVSTGGGYAYTGLDGQRHIAVTPTGNYRVFRKVQGWDESYLGRLYYPSYYSGGYAIHGAKNVPARPVSHGCVRIPLWLSVSFSKRMAIGTPVLIR